MSIDAVEAVPSVMDSQRKKPLRTYSKKRPFSATENPTTEKRRRTSPTTKAEPSTTTDQTPTPELPRLPAPTPSSSFEKGSILNYFKPCRSTSSVDSSILKKLASSSPPIPADHNPPQRAPRRLQLRPPAPLVTGFDEDEGSDSCSSVQPRGHLYLQNAFPSDDSAESTETNSSEDALVLVKPHSSSHEVARHGLLKPQKKPTRTKSAPVQTTINLSTKSTFEECKICRIVYNPLHPPDVRFHTKQHKANMRSLSRA